LLLTPQPSHGGDAITVPPKIISRTYTGAPRGQRYEAWREEVCRGLCKLDVEPAEGEKIYCTSEIVQLSSLALANPTGTSARFARTRAVLSDGCDSLMLVIATSGRVRVTQKVKTTQKEYPIELRPSQMCLIDMSVTGAVDLHDNNRFKTVLIPRRNLLNVAPGAESRLSEPLRENAGLRETIAHHVPFAAEKAVRLDAVGEHLIAQHLTDLIALLIGTGPSESELARQRGLAAAQLQLIQSETLKRLSANTLTIGSVARRCGVSPRHAQRLFEQVGMTFTEFVLEQRLLLARRLLLSPANRFSKIGAIAYDAGFGDLSYFNRVFRRRFGETPSESRNRFDLSNRQ
jgi:AraC-like DNA-binding protein